MCCGMWGSNRTVRTRKCDPSPLAIVILSFGAGILITINFGVAGGVADDCAHPSVSDTGRYQILRRYQIGSSTTARTLVIQ